MSRDIQELRSEIDQIDRQIVSLLKQRLETANEVAEYKRERDLPVLDSRREQALMERVSEQAGEYSTYIRSIYHALLSNSRSFQNVKLGRATEIYDSIRKALMTTPNLFPQRTKVACQGVQGAYAQIACSRMFRHPEIQYCQNFEDVFDAVERGDCQYGVLPIENSTAGSVHMVYDLMSKYQFYIVRSARMKISHNLLAKRGTKLEDIKEVISHEQAISQSARYLLNERGVKVTRVRNTAVAAQMVAESDRTDLAALSSRYCADLYNLEMLEENVQDRDNNYTRFICISKKHEIYPGADKTSMVVTTNHQPGSLSALLAKFYGLGINVQKLESRPIPGREFEFMFYFDIEESVYAPEMETLFQVLEVDCERLRYLGTYHEVIV